jgi:hypothetical protein
MTHLQGIVLGFAIAFAALAIGVSRMHTKAVRP